MNRLHSPLCKSTFFLVCAWLIVVAPATATAMDYEQFLDMSLEELINLEFSTASRFPQKKLDAPSAITVITAKDIKDFGYRTIADAIRSIRGLYTSYDRAYEYIGVRGFGRSGDYNSRMLLMIDGRRVNDAIYDQSYIGTDGLIDMENIERIEFVPGSGSSVYGSNAFLGVMNVITKQGKQTQGGTLEGGFGSYGMDRERASAGYQFDNGADFYVSASRYRSDGHKLLYFPEFDTPQTNNGIAVNQDGDKSDRLFGKFSYQGFTLEGAYSDRKKHLPNAVYDATFNAGEPYRDRNAFVEARYEGDLNEKLNLSARVYYGSYDFDATYPYNPTLNFDTERSQWAGAEIKNIISLGDHTIVLGSEYQNNFDVTLSNYDNSPFLSYLNTAVSSYRYGFYIQDNFSFLKYFTLNAGVRYDHYSVSGGTVNPRIALIFKPIDTLALKLLYGTAFRAPNLYEKYYSLSSIQKAPVGLGPEKTRSYEFVAEYQPSSQLRLIATAYHNEIKNLINLVTDSNDGLLVYSNYGSVSMDGLEAEGDYSWQNGIRLRASYSYVYARDRQLGSWLANSPRHLAKANLSAPLWRDNIRLGLEWQYIGDRSITSGERTSAYNVTNATLTASKIFYGLDISASIYNLFDSRYEHPAGDETLAGRTPQDGRNFRVWFSYQF